MVELGKQFEKRRAAAADATDTKPVKTAVYIGADDYKAARVWCATNDTTFTALMSTLLHRHLASNEATQAKVAGEAKASREK